MKKTHATSIGAAIGPSVGMPAIAASIAILFAVRIPTYAAIIPISPVGGESVQLVPDVQKTIMGIATREERIEIIRQDREHGDGKIYNNPMWRKAVPLKLSWRATEGETGPWKIEIGTEPGLENAEVRYVHEKSEELVTEDRGDDGAVTVWMMPRANLEVARPYWWRVTGRCVRNQQWHLVPSETASFATEDRAPRWIEVEGKVRNIRDFGGWHTTDGHRVRQGMAFRGQGLNDNSLTGEQQGRNRLTVEDVKYFTRTLGIKTDLDLRTKMETADLEESPLGPGVKFILRESQAYRKIFNEDGKKAMAANIRLFCDPGNYPIYFHCIGGADRTGSLAYVLLGVLGVSRHDIETDWESTFYPNIPDGRYAEDYWCRGSHLTDGISKYGADGDTWQRRCELYLLDCGITQDEIARLREILLVESGRMKGQS